MVCLFLKKFLVDICPFMGPLILLFWTSADVSCGFKNQSGQPYSHLAEVYVMYIPQDSPLEWHLPTIYLMANMVPSCFSPHAMFRARLAWLLPSDNIGDFQDRKIFLLIFCFANDFFMFRFSQRHWKLCFHLPLVVFNKLFFFRVQYVCWNCWSRGVMKSQLSSWYSIKIHRTLNTEVAELWSRLQRFWLQRALDCNEQIDFIIKTHWQ